MPIPVAYVPGNESVEVTGVPSDASSVEKSDIRRDLVELHHALRPDPPVQEEVSHGPKEAE